jgi:type II secretory pathway component PulF
MKCDIKMMLKAGLGLAALVAVVYTTFPAARQSLMALTPALFFLLCPLMMFFMMKPEPERFVQLSVLGAATSIPAFMSLDTVQRTTLINEISEETYAAIRQFRNGDTLSLAMSTNIVVAR